VGRRHPSPPTTIVKSSESISGRFRGEGPARPDETFGFVGGFLAGAVGGVLVAGVGCGVLAVLIDIRNSLANR